MFVNSAEKTQQNGLELGIKAQPVRRLNFNGSFAYIKTEIKKNVDEALVGKELNNIPRTVANLMLDYTLESGLGARVNVRNVGKYATGLENFFYYNGYSVLMLLCFSILQELLLKEDSFLLSSIIYLTKLRYLCFLIMAGLMTVSLILPPHYVVFQLE